MLAWLRSVAALLVARALVARPLADQREVRLLVARPLVAPLRAEQQPEEA